MRIKTTLVGLGVLALVAAGCGESLEESSGEGGEETAAATDDAAATGAASETGGSEAAGSGCEAGDAALEGAEITIGSKDFDEQLVLGNISKLLLEDAGVTVNDQINLGGTNPNREALVAGEIGHYWEYTGTAWISFFEEPDPIPDRVEQYEAVRDRDASENGLCWLEPAPFNNTYGIAFRSEAAEELGNPQTIGDIGALKENDPGAATLCVESEFPGRNDGLPGMEETYDFEFGEENVTVLDTGVVYQSTDQGDPCNFGEIFTTDGRIAALELTVLEDDQNFFPLYNVSPVFTSDIYNEYGAALEELYGPVAEALTQETMTELNKRVSSDNERPEGVATSFLQDNGFIG